MEKEKQCECSLCGGKPYITIFEVKTGKKWTQSMVDKSDQITFYALLLWLRYKQLPRTIKLYWAQTVEDLGGILTLSRSVKTFETKRTLKDIILLSKRIKKAWKGICNLSNFKTI